MRRPEEPVSHSAAASLAVVLLALAAVLALLPSLLLPLHEDVQYVTRAAWDLLHHGNLTHSGVTIAFQVLRPGFHFTSPYWLHYITPVLYLYVLFLSFGAADWTFYFGQLLLLFMIGKSLSRGGMGWRGSTAVIAIGILSTTLFGSICESASQLPSIAILAYFWLSWEDEKPPHPILQGILAGVGWDCRPEGFLIGMIAIALNSRRWSDRRRRLRFLLPALAAALGTLAAISLGRRALGAAGSQDQQMLVWMSDVLTPGFNTWGLASLPSFHEVLSDRTLCSRFLAKVLTNLGGAFRSDGLLRQRPDWMVLLLPVILASCKIVRLIDYWPVGILLGLQLLTNATMTSLGRYFDASVFFCLWTLTRDLKARMDERSASLGRIFRGAILLAAAMLLAGQLRGWSRQIDLARLIRRRALAASGEAHRLIPRDAFVITDCPQLWTWYGLGDFCCFVPMGHPETLRLLLDKFPHAYILLFIPGRAGYSMAPFHRPVLNRSTFLALGPPDRAKAVQ